MRHLRELPKCPQLQCDNIDEGWCKENKKWCHLIERCAVKVNSPVDKTLTPKELVTISERHNLLIKNVILSHPNGRVSRATMTEIAEKLDLTYMAVNHKVVKLRKELRKNGQLRTD